MKNILYVFLLLFIITGCSNKVNNLDNNSKSVEKNTSSFEDEFGDEFEDEFKDENKKEFDPLSSYNKVMTSFNDFFYMNILRHISKGYSKVVPQFVRTGISNFFDNILFPARFVNNLLQFKIKNAGEELGRFIFNSSFGLAGLMDPAKNRLDWEEHNEDFGQTLAFYGVGDGFHIVLPFLGPSNLRDMTSLVADAYINPLTSTSYKQISYKIPKNFGQTLSIKSFDTINTVSLKQGQYESIRKDALDLYPFLKNVYNQKRKREIEE